MIKNPSGKPYFYAVFMLAIWLSVTIFFPESRILIIGIGAAAVIAAILIILFHVRSSRLDDLLRSLYKREGNRDRSSAAWLITELLREGTTNRRRGSIVAELISSRFKVEKFAFFFYDRGAYSPIVHSGIHPAGLNRPRASRIRPILRSVAGSGVIANRDDLFDRLFRRKDWELFESPLTFYYRWGRSKSMILIADDRYDLLKETLANHEFNRVFWPAVGTYLQEDGKMSESLSEARKIKDDLSAARKEIYRLNSDLNQKLLDLQSFVRISGELYSIFDEDQLFESLKSTVSGLLGARRIEILCPDGNARFVRYSSDDTDPEPGLILSADSELFGLLEKSAKPVVLPVLSSGFEKDEQFLNYAIGRGFLIASTIRVGNQAGCVLLVSERKEDKNYSDSDIDILSTISNIASLALENIRQYSTIEKLSYTDSMTGVFNYRYFYKRLSEEILRAKRFNRVLSLVILDIDNFKLFNDRYGHQIGDMVLKRLSKIITDTIRTIDVVSRYGGEEFCIIMPDTNETSCGKFIERLRKEISEFRLESGKLKDNEVITVSVGGAVYPLHASTADRIIYCADMALLKAKASGRNRAVMYQAEFSDKEESSIGGIK
jgi:diguanylate cyclase (GGDEF)-like protein